MRLIKEPKHGDSFDCTNTAYPTILEVVGEEVVLAHKHATTYGFVLRGAAQIVTHDSSSKLGPGGYFAVPGDGTAIVPAHRDGESLVVTVTRFGFLGMLHIGQTEKVGRLSYIDGCSDTLLIPPPRLGDPCFNYLHFPPGILQTQHTHPSIRAGIVARGQGHAFRLPAAGTSGWEQELSPGCVFILEPQEVHSFRTDKSDETMDVIAYHPDSDWGPTDAVHPMRNRTYMGNDRGPSAVSS